MISSPRPNAHRPDIDGLRCVAVLLVVLFHAFPQASPGGFVGVDVFFVISGYLISSIVTSRVDEGRFGLGAFYGNRIRRIFPALITMIVAVFAFAWFRFSPEEMVRLGHDMFGGATFISNFIFALDVGYFDVGADRTALLHLWSLGVEEQFYIVWPLALAALLRRRRLAVPGLALLVALSFAAGVIVPATIPNAPFYLPHARAWELLIGAAAALLVRERGEIIPEFARGAASVVGLGLILIAATTFAPGEPYPGWRALLPTIGALLIIASPTATLNRRLLASRPAVAVGLVSYPLYLWHWPLLIVARAHGGGEAIAAAVVAAFVLAWLTNILVERPIRFDPRRRTAKTAGCCLLMVLIGAVGLHAVSRGGYPFRIPKLVRTALDAKVDPSTDWRRGKCFLDPDMGASAFAPECAGASRSPSLFLWGDSHAAALYPGLRSRLKGTGIGLAQYTASGCPPLLGVERADRPLCPEINAFVIDEVGRERPDTVLLHATWRYDPAPLKRTVTALRRIGVRRVVVLGPVPRWGARGLPAALVDYYRDHRRLPPRRTDFGLEREVADLDLTMRREADLLGVEYLSAWGAMCDETGCLSRLGDDASDITAWDREHLTMTGSGFLADFLIPRLFPDGSGRAAEVGSN